MQAISVVENETAALRRILSNFELLSTVNESLPDGSHFVTRHFWASSVDPKLHSRHLPTGETAF